MLAVLIGWPQAGSAAGRCPARRPSRAAGLGALLLFAASELAVTRRLFDSKPSCWPVIAATAAVTLWANPFWGLVAGACAELLRQAILRPPQRNARA